MAQLNVLHYPDPRLRQKAAPVTQFDEQLETFANDMVQTMYACEGIGLAAIQVNVKQRVITLDVSEQQDQPMIMVNPEITAKSGKAFSQEGCLSVPDYFEQVERAEKITVKYQDVHGESHEINAEGLLAVCIQHEIDHLNGRLFVDYLSDLKRDKALKLMRKQSKAKSTAQ